MTEAKIMLQQFNAQLEKRMPIITPVSVILGVLFAHSLHSFAFLVPWLFAFMTFAGSLSSNFRSFKEAVLHPLPIFLTLAILHIFMPLGAWAFGHLAFHGDLFTITGLTLAMAIPTGITSFIWVSIYKGNIPLTLSVILIDTFLSPLIVPYTVSFFIGAKVEMNTMDIMSGLIGMIVIPSLIGMLANQISKGKAKEVLAPRLAPFSKIFLGIVVLINSSVIAPYLRHIDWKLVEIAAAVFLIAFSGYYLSFIIGRIFKQKKDTVVAITFLGGMRNISAGAVVAVSYFPAKAAVPVVIGMLFQQILASTYGHIVDHYYRKQAKASEKRVS